MVPAKLKKHVTHKYKSQPLDKSGDLQKSQLKWHKTFVFIWFCLFQKGVWRYQSVVQHLPDVSEALDSIPTPQKNKKVTFNEKAQETCY
jgi:hypothetical protein